MVVRARKAEEARTSSEKNKAKTMTKCKAPAQAAKSPISETEAAALARVLRLNLILNNIKTSDLASVSTAKPRTSP